VFCYGRSGLTGNSLLREKKFPTQLIQGISRQVIETASLSGAAIRGGHEIQKNSLLNSLPAGKLVLLTADLAKRTQIFLLISAGALSRPRSPTKSIAPLNGAAVWASTPSPLDGSQPCVVQFPVNHERDRVPSEPAIPFQQRRRPLCAEVLLRG
jgi:hypothetical protein